MTLTRSRWMFAGIWLGGAGLVFLILVVQSLVGRCLLYTSPSPRD